MAHFLGHPRNYWKLFLPAPAAVKGFASVAPAVASFVVVVVQAIIIFGMQTKAHINL